MSAINFSNRAAKNLRGDTESLKRATVRRLEEVKKNPGRHLTPIEGYSFYKVDIDDEHIAIVEWLEQRDEIRVLTVGPRERFHDPVLA